MPCIRRYAHGRRRTSVLLMYLCVCVSAYACLWSLCVRARIYVWSYCIHMLRKFLTFDMKCRRMCVCSMWPIMQQAYMWHVTCTCIWEVAHLHLKDAQNKCLRYTQHAYTDCVGGYMTHVLYIFMDKGADMQRRVLTAACVCLLMPRCTNARTTAERTFAGPY